MTNTTNEDLPHNPDPAVKTAGGLPPRKPINSQASASSTSKRRAAGGAGGGKSKKKKSKKGAAAEAVEELPPLSAAETKGIKLAFLKWAFILRGEQDAAFKPILAPLIAEAAKKAGIDDASREKWAKQRLADIKEAVRKLGSNLRFELKGHVKTNPLVAEAFQGGALPKRVDFESEAAYEAAYATYRSRPLVPNFNRSNPQAYVGMLHLVHLLFDKKQGLGVSITSSSRLNKIVSPYMEAALLHWVKLFIGGQDAKCSNNKATDPPAYDKAQMATYQEILQAVAADRSSNKAAEQTLVDLYQQQLPQQQAAAAAPVPAALVQVIIVEEESDDEGQEPEEQQQQQEEEGGQVGQ